MKIQIEPEISHYAPKTYCAIMSVLSDEHCDTLLLRVRKKIKKKRSEFLKYPVLEDRTVRNIDAMIVFSPYATSHKAKYWSQKYRKPLLHLELGFLPKSILCDIDGFWGESKLCDVMPKILDTMSNEQNYKWAISYSTDLVENNRSKRVQPNTHTDIEDSFVFLPMQYMNDQSVLKFGNMSYSKFMTKVASFCHSNKIILAVKKHPHAYRKEIKEVNKLLSILKKKFGQYFIVVDGSIHWFCQNCLFMAGMNTGAIADGLINGCIISHCGQSIFMNSGAVIHDNDVTQGLQKCLSLQEDEKNRMVFRQKILLYYLYNRYLILEDDTHHSEYSNEDKVRNQLRNILDKST